MTVIRVGTPEADLQLALAFRAVPFERRLELYREVRELACQRRLAPKGRAAKRLLLRFCRNMIALAELDP